MLYYQKPPGVIIVKPKTVTKDNKNVLVHDTEENKA